MDFALHPKLLADTAAICDWSLSRVLLMNDRRFPWIILVPRRADISEIFGLDEADRAVLMDEIVRGSENLKAWAKAHGGCDKINVGSLGNMVPQLHVHVVARVASDAAWPGPVWGAGQAEPYSADELGHVVTELRGVL